MEKIVEFLPSSPTIWDNPFVYLHLLIHFPHGLGRMKHLMYHLSIPTIMMEEEKYTYIRVEEDYDGCKAYWGCLEDGPTSSAPDEDCYPEMDADEQFDYDWSEDELIEEIESQLSYDLYIEIDDTIYPVENSIEDFIEEYRNENECEPDYSELTAHEVAERLAEEIEFL